MVSPYSSSLWNCWLKLALRHYVSTQICSFLGRKSFGKILPWLVSQAHSASQHADTESDRHCETERVWLARVRHDTQDVLFVIKWPTAFVCLSLCYSECLIVRQQPVSEAVPFFVR